MASVGSTTIGNFRNGFNTTKHYEIDGVTATSSLKEHNILVDSKEKAYKGWIHFLDQSNRWLGHKLPWRLEVLCWIASLLSFGAIVVVAATYDGQPIPRWHLGITVNALVSILATVGTIALMTPIAAGMGQLKWIWFRARNPINDFDTIDQASRGIWGSIVLLMRMRGGALAAIGAILTILMIVVHPIIQQVITYEGRMIQVTEPATLPITLSLKPTTTLDKPGYWVLEVEDFTMTGSIYSALFSNPSTAFNSSANCPTSNCAWPAYDTLAICSTCRDISDHVNTTKVSYQDKGETREWVDSCKLPNNVSLEVYPLAPPITANYIQNFITVLSRMDTNTYQNDSGTISAVPSVAFSEAGSLVNGFFTISNDSKAYECILQYCVKSFTAVYINGSLYETELSRWSNNSHEGRMLVSTASTEEDTYGFTELYMTPPSRNTTFQVALPEHVALASVLGDIFNGTVSGEWWLRANQVNFTGLLMMSWASDALQDLYGVIHSGGVGALSDLMNNIADSLTLNIRSRPNGTTSATGAAYAQVTVLRVQWWWLTMPGALLILSLAFLFLVIIRTRTVGAEVWKSNTLAMLFHGPEENALTGLGLLRRVEHMEEAGERLVVRLVVGDHGWRLAATDEQEEADDDHYAESDGEHLVRLVSWDLSRYNNSCS